MGLGLEGEGRVVGKGGGYLEGRKGDEKALYVGVISRWDVFMVRLVRRARVLFWGGGGFLA